MSYYSFDSIHTLLKVFLSPTVLRTEGDLQVDHLYLCIFLTTLLLGDTTDTGFSLVECYGGFVWELIAYFVLVTTHVTEDLSGSLLLILSP